MTIKPCSMDTLGAIRKRNRYGNAGLILNEFMNMNVECAEVSDVAGEGKMYKSLFVAQHTLHTAAKKGAIPANSAVRGDHLYLYRTDM